MAAIAGITLVIISATPLPVWAYAVWVISAGAGIVVGNLSAPTRRLRLICGAVLAVLTSALCLAEAPFRCRPALNVPAGGTVYVLGDSISAGVGTQHLCWPVVLDGMTPLRVINLAKAGATVESAITQARGTSEPQSLVLVAIGGNDLLGGADAAEFHMKLDTLVSSLRSDQHDVLLFELPLFPFQNAYGTAQRDVARKYGCAMLPKRCFAKVLGTQDGTLDGLHLSQAGHNAMAGIIADLIRAQ